MTSTVMIVDTAPSALPNHLERGGYETITVTCGRQALRDAKELRPDVIIMNVMMPHTDGVDICRRLSMNPATADIPVILISTQSMDEARVEGLLAGATDYVIQPINVDDLSDRVKKAIRLKGTPQPDHHQMLEDMAYTTLSVLPCDLVWVLVADTSQRWLSHQTIATVDDPEQFLQCWYNDQGSIRFPLVSEDNVLAEFALAQSKLINTTPGELGQHANGSRFGSVFAHFGWQYISLLPLVASGHVVGIMVLAAADRMSELARIRQILDTLSRQAAMIVHNARLLADLAVHEGQVRVEQAFRQMVLDTMGEGLIVVDQNAAITYVNKHLLRMTDYTRKQLYGQSVGLLFHPDQREQLVGSLTDRRRGTLPFSQQLFTRHQQQVPVLLSRAVIPAPDGRGKHTVMVVTDLSEVQRNEEALKRQTERLQAINQASDAIASARTFDEVVVTSLEAGRQVVRGVSASLLLYDGEYPGNLTVITSVGPQGRKPINTVVSPADDLSGWVARTGKSQLVFDSEDPAARSMIVVPLIASDEVLGVLEVVEKQEGIFDDQDLKTLESLASSAGIAIENIRLLDQMRRRVTELSTLLDASAAASSTLDFGDILERIARRLSLALRVERVLLADWNHQANCLQSLTEVANTYWPPGKGPTRPLHDLSSTRAVLEFGTPVLAEDSDRNTKRPEEKNASGLWMLVGFPIRIQGQIVGVAALYNVTPQAGLENQYASRVANVVTEWQNRIDVEAPDDWASRANLTDLCQRILQTSSAQWCTVSGWDRAQHAVYLLREVGHVLWLNESGRMWDITRYVSMGTVLKTNAAFTLHADDLAHDPQEAAYLHNVGGHICLLAPLLIRGEAVGLVKLIDSQHKNRVFDHAELSLCQGIANVVGNAMENAQLYAEQEQRASALEAAYTDLKEADNLKDELLQNLSHELQTPLTHILGYLRLMADETFGQLTSEQAHAVNLVLNKAHQLADLVKDIVMVQETDIQPKTVHLERVAELAIRGVTAQSQERGITINLHVSEDLPLVEVDPVQTGEILEELLSNAIKFSPNRSSIDLNIDNGGGPMVHIQVRDYGLGIPASEHDRIFRRFYQVDSGTTRRFGGTGLGLAIVRQVVEAHNGQVWLESQPGEGSCFHVTLPKVASE
jgi:PAS domain S-box-containing protein